MLWSSINFQVENSAACGWAIIPPRVSKDLVSLGKARWWWKRFLFYRNSQSCCHGNIHRESLIQPCLKVLDQIILFSWTVWENTICWVPPPEILMLEVWGGAGTLHGQAPRWHRWCWASGPPASCTSPAFLTFPAKTASQGNQHGKQVKMSAMFCKHEVKLKSIYMNLFHASCLKKKWSLQYRNFERY